VLLPLKDGFVYGPVRSRRLGASLGINVLPPGQKVCSFNCVYCQYGWTAPDLLDEGRKVDYPAPESVLIALGKALLSLPERPAYLTFSGHGEATLHPRFGELVDGVTVVRDRLARGARTAILSNSTRVGDAGVREALSRLDVRIMKLDAGTPAGMAAFNAPHAGVDLDAIVAGLAALPDVTLQSMFAGGLHGNLVPSEIEAWLEAVVAIRPCKVQLYSLDRATPSHELLPAGRSSLLAIAAALAGRGIPAEVY
jgi:wyosine [tRNA(Phe)-imidazoG37] synthetase (radical SAM superfamily)